MSSAELFSARTSSRSDMTTMVVPARQISFYFSIKSIWSYVGHEAINAFAAEHAVALLHRPVHLGSLFAVTGGTVLRQRHVSRQRYRDFEIQRWCKRRGITIDLSSPHLSADPLLADCLFLAATVAGHDAEPLLGRLFTATWRERRDIGDPATVAAVANEVGLDGANLVERARSAAVLAAYERNLGLAMADNVFGLPSFVLDGETFWGQDRLDFLGEALLSGRPPYRASL